LTEVFPLFDSPPVQTPPLLGVDDALFFPLCLFRPDYYPFSRLLSSSIVVVALVFFFLRDRPPRPLSALVLVTRCPPASSEHLGLPVASASFARIESRRIGGERGVDIPSCSCSYLFSPLLPQTFFCFRRYVFQA